MKSVAAASSSAGGSSAASNRDTPTPPPPGGDEDEVDNGKSQRRNRFREILATFGYFSPFCHDKSKIIP